MKPTTAMILGTRGNVINVAFGQVLCYSALSVTLVCARRNRVFRAPNRKGLIFWRKRDTNRA